MEADLAFALELADLADTIALPRFRAAGLSVESKTDLSPVTDADRAVEAVVRRRVAAERPGDGVFGEEGGGGAGTADGGGDGAAAVRWIVDPIDGTRNFARGIPVWATLLALERDGVVVASVVSAPALGRRRWASRGGGAFATGDVRLRVSTVERWEDAVVSATLPDARLQGCWHLRALGDFWSHTLVAEGAVDVAVDEPLNLWDYAPVQLVVEEAGGRVTTVGGGPPAPGERIVSSNGRLHDRVLAALSGS